MLIALVSVFGIGISKININENIFSTLPKGNSFEKFTKLIDEGDLSNQVVFSLAIDSGQIDEIAFTFKDSLKKYTKNYLKDVVVQRSNIEEDIYKHYYDHFPAFITADYYQHIAEKTNKKAIDKELQQTQQSLLSPGGFLFKQFLLNDPVGISTTFLKELNEETNVSNYNVEDGYLLSKNKNELLVTAKTTFSLSDNQRNVLLYKALQEFQKKWNKTHTSNQVDFFGTFQISAENSIQVKKDTFLTLIITLVLVLLILFIYYRKILIPLYFMLPLIFGGLFALAMIGFFKSEISAISIATGAVVFGIVLDFSFHFFTHLQHSKSLTTTIKEVSTPLLIGGGTTILAFGALTFTNSVVLQNFGLFASLSLIGAALFTLIGLPVLLELFNFNYTTSKEGPLFDFSFLDKIRKPLLLTIVVLTGVFLYFSFDVQFDKNLDNLSFHSQDSKDKEQDLMGINPQEETKLFIFSEANDLQTASLNNYKVYLKLNELQEQGKVKSTISISKFLLPDSIVDYRYNTWDNYWEVNSAQFVSDFDASAKKLDFNEAAFLNFKNWITNKKQLFDNNGEELLKKIGLKDLIYQNNNKTTMITTVILKKDMVEKVISKIGVINGVSYFNRGQVAKDLLSIVKDDFNYILILSSLLVFVCLLLIYGRIELALFTFIPMVISWIWILGIAAIFDLKFNFVNIVIVTFIFGLGDDFSIFVTDGLLHKYKYKKNTLKSYNTAIVLSALTTIVGTGVLILAKHPAIHSVALISVLGILCILCISLVVQPYLFQLFIQGRVDQKKTPISFIALTISIFEFPWFVFGCMVTYIILGVLLITPLPKKYKRMFLNTVLSSMAWSVIYSALHVKTKVFNKKGLDFSNPSIIIANHTSFLDILLMMLLSPKIIIVVKEWVYNSVFFGPIVRYAGYVFVGDGPEKNLEVIRERIAEGYSLLIFPEGSRGKTDKIRRFHKGAFFLAKELNLDITPVLIHGASHVLPKSEFFVRHGHLNIKVLPRIKAEDLAWGETFGKRTKSISNLYKKEYLLFKEEQETAKQLFPKIFANYTYKGALLEWYLKVKWNFEAKNYDHYHSLLSDKMKILDVGCGYGYLSYFLHYKNEEREILGVDYDDEKIAIANNGYDRTEKLNFESVDITTSQLLEHDAILLNDVLHYFSKEKQDLLLNKCTKALTQNGIILIRDGVTDFDQRHKKTKLTELFSTKLLSFNKKEEAFHYFSCDDIKSFATENKLSYTMVEQTDKTSNVLFVLKKL